MFYISSFVLLPFLIFRLSPKTQDVLSFLSWPPFPPLSSPWASLAIALEHQSEDLTGWNPGLQKMRKIVSLRTGKWYGNQNPKWPKINQNHILQRYIKHLIQSDLFSNVKHSHTFLKIERYNGPFLASTTVWLRDRKKVSLIKPCSLRHLTNATQEIRRTDAWSLLRKNMKKCMGKQNHATLRDAICNLQFCTLASFHSYHQKISLDFWCCKRC